MSAPKGSRAVLDAVALRPRMGGRLTLDDPSDRFNPFQMILPPNDYEGSWRTLNLDRATLDRIDPARLLSLLIDLSPDISRALWDFQRLCNPGYKATALRPGGEEADPVGQAALDAFLDHLSDLYGSVDVVLGRLHIGTFLRGALLAELILDEPGRLPIDVATPDPATIRFRRQVDPVRGVVWQLGQWQGWEFVPFDRPTIRYVPVDPPPGSPYGRPMASPALFTALFVLGLLHDLRRVVAQQGYPRLDLSVDLAVLNEMMPEAVKDDPEASKAWIDGTIADIQQWYGQLEPDSAFVHMSSITVNRPVGTVDSSSLGGIDALLKGLERMAARALKTMPLLMGTTDGVSEANANRQWELMAAGIKSIQHHTETLLERLLGLGLQVQGIQADVRFRFAELRASETLRDAQSDALLIANAERQYWAGWISQDEAAQKGAGKSMADVPEPRALPQGETPTAPANPSAVEADPGSNRGLPVPVRIVDGPLDAESVNGNGTH